MSTSEFIIIAIVVLILIGIPIALRMSGRRRHERLEEEAQQHGLTYHRSLPELAESIVTLIDGTADSSSKFEGVFEGEHSGKSYLAGTAEWSTTNGVGEDSSIDVHNRKVVARQIPLNVQSFVMMPSGGIRLFQGSGIQTEWAEFNNAWYVKSDNDKFALALLSPSVQEWFMTKPNYLFGIHDGIVAVFRPGALSHKDIGDMLTTLDEFDQRIAPFLRDDYRGNSNSNWPA
ncbi:hypothetical protein [Flaviflexus massiliensis]|uniref:hypothetical protein n=1 Tax=Flaviflexus massiliensis TaxID=1522309 RepID=UPI0006D5AB09|nr:hypothetical protein [Flaviflexus massiliensis]